MLFYEGGVATFQSLSDGALYRTLRGLGPTPPDRIWALVDSNRDMSSPAQVFGNGRFFVVNAVPPRANRQNWAKDYPID